MNKNEILDQLMDIRELTIGADSPGDNLQADLMEIRKIASKSIEEVYSKPIMPKVFDDWYKDITAESSDIQGIVTYFKFTIDGKYNNFGPEKTLFDWVHSGKYSKVLGMNLIDKTRYKKCLEAILYGYEFDN